MRLSSLVFDYRMMRSWDNGRLQSFLKAVWMHVFRQPAYIYPHRWLILRRK